MATSRTAASRSRWSVDRAVAEVQADDVDPGAHHRLELRRLVGGRPERGDDLRASGHTCLSSRWMHVPLAHYRSSTVDIAAMADFPAADPTAGLRAHLDASPSPWHAVRTSAAALEAAGFTALDERARGPTCPTPGTSGGAGRSSAWRRPAGGGPLPVHIVGAHTDSPGLRVKPHPDGAPGRLAAARRGDLRRRAAQQLARPRPRRRRPARVSPTAADTLVDVAEPIARVPQLAIHLDRDVNERGLVLDRQAHMTPVWATAHDDLVRRVDRRRAAAAMSRRGGSCACTTCSRPPCSAPTARCSPAVGSTTWRRAGRRRRRWWPPSRPTTWR